MIMQGNIPIFLITIILAISLRASLVDYKTLDYYTYLKPLYNTISSTGFSVFATNLSTYNPPYLYLLYVIARLFPIMPAIIAVKLPAMAADFLCGYFVFRIVDIKYKTKLIPLLSGTIVLFSPTVLLNSAFWGQADSLFTAGILSCIYFLMEKKFGLAFICYGIALAFKLQAIFLIPLLFALFLNKTVSWKYILILPVILIMALVPSWVAGRHMLDLLNIYPNQISQFQSLSMNAASIYSWFPTTDQVFNLVFLPGIVAGAVTGFFIVAIVCKSPNVLSKSMIVELALLASLAIPFLLPKMRERYFYPADLISIAFAFYNPQFFYIPIIIGGVSFFSYQAFLFNSGFVPLPVLTLILLTAISILVYHTLLQLYSSNIIINKNSLSSNMQDNESM